MPTMGFRRGAAVLWLMSTAAGAQAVAADANLADLKSSGATIATHPATNAVRFIGFPKEQAAQLDRPQNNAVDAAREFTTIYGAMFGLRKPAEELRLSKETVRAIRGSNVRFQQVFQGIPVIGGEVIVNLDSQNRLLAMSGEVSPKLTLSVKPVISASESMTIATEAVAKWHGVDRGQLSATEPVLSILAPILLKPSAQRPSLVWKTLVSHAETLPIREVVFVDAATGSIRIHFNQVDTARNRRSHTAGGTAALPGVLVCSEVDPQCTGGDADVAAAHRYAGDAYDFYRNVHGRDSFDNAGGAVVSTVHWNDGFSCPNAYWNGTQMVYCDYTARADDLVAHEFTHGVTQRESNLLYYYQSGAINESFSDIWGEFVDLSNSSGTDTASVRWLMGEDTSGAFRDLRDPPAFGDPDRMQSPWYWFSSGDQGGVHTNSGIGNKAAYLMTDGDTFNGVTVNGLGINKVAAIYYEAQTALLTSASDYADLSNALNQGCLNLIGTAGISVDDCDQVRNATRAVEMDQQPAGGFAPDATLCPGGGQPAAIIFKDDMESSSNWNTINIIGSNPWRFGTNYATSGIRSLSADDPPFTSDTAAFTAGSIPIPAGAVLHFRHAFGFEGAGNTSWDGGVVEYSTNGSATWNDLGPLFSAGQDYRGTLPLGNPLAGRNAFVGESHGYVSSRYDLGSLAGQNVRFRFRQASDATIGGPLGWAVDDVQVHTCTGQNASRNNLINISTRGRVQTGDNVMIGGFIIGGNSPRTVLIRARGPSLANAGVPGVLANPNLKLLSGQSVIAANDDWSTSPQAAGIQATGQAPPNPNEAAILTTLAPGSYTAIVNGIGGTSGVGIVEVFDVETNNGTSRLVNLSTRGRVETGDNVMIGGFIIHGDTAKTVLIRARGPSLANAGVPGVLANPNLRLFSGQTVIASNDNWSSSPQAATIQATGEAPPNPNESAILATLAPGSYTAIVNGVGDSSGVGIVEVLEISSGAALASNLVGE